MRSRSRQYWPAGGLAVALVLLGLAGAAKADEVVVSDLNDNQVAEASPNLENSLAQVDRDARGPVVSGPAASPKPPAKPKTPPRPLTVPRAETPPPPENEPSPDLLASLFGANSPAAEGLAGTPNMFGDFFNNLGGSVLADRVSGIGGTGFADLPLAAGCRRVKIAEDDSAVPQDRVFFLYNHFQDSLDMARFRVERKFSVDRYTLGVEKTFLDDAWSAEWRMPVAGTTEFATPDFGVSGESTGNLAVIVKRCLHRSCNTAVTMGIGVDTPTGSDADGYAKMVAPFKTTVFTVHNNAVHLLPFAGFVRAPSDRFFYQGFAQADIAANGNRIDFAGTTYATPKDSGTLGTLNEQNLLYLDLSGGYWLYRNSCSRGLTGLASLLEVHYTTTLQDTDVVQGTVWPHDLRLTFENFANRVDIVDLTVGLHAEFANHTLCRVGGVFPLSWGDNRSFDSEVQVQVERRF
jgi:hypothetical protein